MNTQVFVHGGAVSRSWRDTSMSLNDLIFATVSSALENAQVPFADVDSVVLSAHDITDGRSLSSMVTAPSAGAYMKDEVRLGDDGAASFVVGAARVRSGMSKFTLIAAWGRASEGEPESIANAMFDPFYTRPLGMTEVAVSALRAGAALQRHSGYADHRERAAALRDNLRFGAGEIASCPAPLRANEVPVWADVATALVISSEPSDVVLAGVGMSTEPFYLGDRDLVAMPALRAASQQATAQAQISISDVDVLELDGLSLFDEALALEAVGAAAEGLGMATMVGTNTLNTDGGYAAGYCAPAMGLVRIAQAATRLRTGGSIALASGSSVVAAQSQTAVALRRA